MRTSMYRQKSLQDESFESLDLLINQIKSFLYKHHTLVGYF